LLVLISMVEEAWPLLLSSESILECSGGWIIVPCAYPFDELFHFGRLYGLVLDVVIGRCEWWFHYIFEH